MAKINKGIKKEVEKYMKLPYTRKLIKEDDGTYYIAIEELPGCASMGDTIEEAMEMIKDAMRGWLESNIARGLEIPIPEVMKEYSGRFVLRLPISLHRRLANEAKKEGVSLNQYVVSILSEDVSIKNIERVLNEQILQIANKNLSEKFTGEESMVFEGKWRGKGWKKDLEITMN